jgi:hypothetical protein
MLLGFPSPLLDYVLQFCSGKDLLRVALTCTSLNESAADVARYIIKKVIKSHYPSLASRRSSWMEGKSVFGNLVDLIEPKIVVIRGFITFSMQISNHHWKRCHDSKRDRGYFGALFFKGEVYAIGTYSLVAAGTVEKYDPFSDNWFTVTPLPRKLRSVGAAVWKDSMYCTGGIESHSEIVIDHICKFNEENDKANQQDFSLKLPGWIDIGVRLLRPRYRHAAVEYENKIWIAGGCFASLDATNTVEIFDPVTNTVLEGPSMLVKRDFANLLVVNNELFAVGGDVDAVGNQAIRSIEKYDTFRHRWVHVTVFKDTRRGFSTCAEGDKIYVFGGSNDSHEDLRTWDAYDIKRQEWVSDRLPAASRQMPMIDSWGQAVTFPSTPITW